MLLVVMDESKKAAKAFVDQYFPVRNPNPKSTDVFGELLSPNTRKESIKKQGGYGVQILNAHGAAADGKFQGHSNKNHQPHKGSNGAEHREVSEPCLMSSSVDYGCRDDYPYDPDNRYPGPSSYIDKKDRKDGSDYANPETAGAEWWQGSFYY